MDSFAEMVECCGNRTIFMKIISIDEALSTPTRVALITEPPIDSYIFEAIERMTRDDYRSPLDPPTPFLSSLRLASHNGRLIVNTLNFDAHTASNIQSLLDEAEKRSKDSKQARDDDYKKTTEANQNQKQALINSAISAFKIPPK
jgi:hypothetical protein